jgi:hypothetical protein
MDVLGLMGILIEHPWLALIPAAAFLACAAISKRRTVLLVVAVTWLLYFAYELAIKFRVLCSDECDIRVDLLVLYPLLLGVSVVGMVAVTRNLLSWMGGAFE